MNFKCAGNNQSFEDWVLFWRNDDQCYNFLYDQMYNENGNFILSGYLTNQIIMNDAINKYLQTNKITDPGTSGYNSFQEDIKQTCTSLPGICDPALRDYCSSCANCQSRLSVASSLSTLNFCGCYSKPPLSAVLITSPECDPLCSREDTIKLPNKNGGNLVCESRICVIDQITIAATNTSGGSLTFNQVCSDCGIFPCKCIISADVSSISDFNQETYDQRCSSDSVCISPNSEGVDVVVPCKTSFFGKSSKTEIYILIFSLAIFFFFVILILMFSK